MDQVRDMLEGSDLSQMVNVIEQKLIEEDYTALDLAAALLKMQMGEDNEDIIDNFEPARSLDELDRYSRSGRRYGRDGRENLRGGRSRRRGAVDRAAIDYVVGDDMARLFVNIGRNQNVSPGDILGAVAGESGIPGRVVGSIDMYDGYTFVEVPRKYSDQVLKAMENAKIKGKKIRIERANGRDRR